MTQLIYLYPLIREAAANIFALKLETSAIISLLWAWSNTHKDQSMEVLSVDLNRYWLRPYFFTKPVLAQVNLYLLSRIRETKPVHTDNFNHLRITTVSAFILVNINLMQ